MITQSIKENRFIYNFKKYRYFLLQLVNRDIKLKYRKSVLGIFWSLLEPLIFMIVITIIFSTVFQRAIPNFPVYYLTGYLIFAFFSSGTNAALRSIISKGTLLTTIYVPKYLFCLSAVLSNFVTFLISLIVLFAVMFATHVNFTIYIIFSSLPILALLFLTIGVGLILATLNVFFRDLQHLWGVFTKVLMWGLALFYPPEIIPESYRWILYYNPIYAIIACCRDSFLYGTLYNPLTLSFAIISGIMALIIGIIIFYKYQNKFILHI